MGKSSCARRVTVIGLGYVGLTTAAGLAELGHKVVGLDVDSDRVARLCAGELPFFEPELAELIECNAERLRFTDSYESALADAEFAFIAVPTPSTSVDAADLSYVRATIHRLVEASGRPLPVVVNKSTVPIGTGDTLEAIVAATGEQIHIVSNPEFTREGRSVHDFFQPDRVVIGSHDEECARAVAALYEGVHAPIVYTDLRTAEMIKYASNAFLATKISFINEIAAICDAVGADVTQVADGMGLDARIGRAFLNAGLGFGGSCLPKDVRALVHVGSVYGTHPQLLTSVLQINQDQRRRVVKQLRDLLGDLEGRRICLLGLTFKPHTDDLRNAPSLDLIPLLVHEGASIAAYDPVADPRIRVECPDLEFPADAYAAARDADAVVLVTEWPEFRDLDPERLAAAMRSPILIDARNYLDADAYVEAGFRYSGVGRGTAHPRKVALR